MSSLFSSSNQYSSTSHIFYSRLIKIYGQGWYTWWCISLNSSAVPWATSGHEILWYTFDSNGDTTYVENFQLATGIKFWIYFQSGHALLVEMKSWRICIIIMHRHLLFTPRKLGVGNCSCPKPDSACFIYIRATRLANYGCSGCNQEQLCSRGWLLGGIWLSRLLNQESVQ